MAALIPGAGYRPSAASGVDVIDGSLKFDRVSDSVNVGYLIRTFTAGNSKKWTWSAWIKRDKFSITNRIFGGNGGTANNDKYFTVLFGNPDYLRIGAYSSFLRTSNALYRDDGWYHIVVNVDIDNASSALKYRAYINGEEVTWGSTGDETDTGLNRAGFKGYIGAEVYGGTPNNGFGGRMSQCYFLDGLSLGPGYFGYNDPLTNVWRPKTFEAKGTTVNNGTTWSSGTTNGSAYSGSYTWTTTFNGNPMNSYGATESGTSANPYNIALPDIPFSSLTLYTQHGGATSVRVFG